MYRMWRLCRCMPNRFNHIRLIIIIYTLFLERIMYRIGIKNAIFTLCKGWHFLCNIIYVTFHNIFYNIFKIFLIVFLLIFFIIFLIVFLLIFFIIFLIVFLLIFFNIFIVSLNYFYYLSLLSVSLCVAFF